MNLTDQKASSDQTRRIVYTLIVLSSVAYLVGRIMSVHTHHIEIHDGRPQLAASPLLSANDRSRWCTIRALVDHHTYEIDKVLRPNGRSVDKKWNTIDKVRHKGWDGREHAYSSKPPLLPTMLAGVYWALQQVTGATLQRQPFYVVRIMLILVNVIPLLAAFGAIVRLVEKHAKHDLTRYFVVAAACWGTFLTTFAVTLNNHLPAALCALAATLFAMRIWFEQRHDAVNFVMAGLFAAFAAANELPALSFLAVVGLGLLWKAPRPTLLWFTPAVVVVAAGFFGANYAAHGTWRPAYAHRHDGRVLVTLEVSSVAALRREEVPAGLADKLKSHDIRVSESAVILPSAQTNRWVLWDRVGQDRLALVAHDSSVEVHAWGNWYDYPNSYWQRPVKPGVDAGEPSRVVYALQMLVGHYGVFSLTPLWLFSLVGVGLMLRSEHRPLAVMVIALTLVCVAFYIARPQADRNYGGISCGFRWLFWLIPLWLFCLIPAFDRCVMHKWGRIAILTALSVSIFSSVFAGDNPWTYPWLYKYWSSLNWI